jgi:hypothetical protein
MNFLERRFGRARRACGAFLGLIFISEHEGADGALSGDVAMKESANTGTVKTGMPTGRRMIES